MRNPTIPPDIYDAICRIVEYLDDSEIKNLAECDPDEKLDAHIAQSLIKLTKWAGGRLWLDLSDEIEAQGLIELPSGKWAARPDAGHALLDEKIKKIWNEPDDFSVTLKDGRKVARRYYDPKLHGPATD